MHLDERSDSHLGISNKGGMCTSASFPTTNIPLPYEPQLTPVGQGTVAMGDGVIQMGNSGEYAAKFVSFKFFGTGAVGANFGVQIYHWSSTNGQFMTGGGTLGVQKIWIPVLLGQYNVIMGNNQGVATTDIDQRFLFAGTITQTYGPTSPSGVFLTDQTIYSPGNGGVAMLVLRVLGARFLEVAYAMGTATSANCLTSRGG